MHGLPADWLEVVDWLAFDRRWPPESIDRLTINDLLWWSRRAVEWARRHPGG